MILYSSLVLVCIYVSVLIDKQGVDVMAIRIVGVDSSKYRRAADPDVVVCLQILNHQLYLWYNEQPASATDFIDLINKAIDHGIIKIASSATRVQERIRTRACRISKEYKQKNRRKKSEYLTKYTYFDIKYNEIVNVSLLEEEIESLHGIVEDYR